MQMEELDGLDQMEDETQKERCESLLENLNSFERQELIDKYGELD
jgi:hypothetical protein